LTGSSKVLSLIGLLALAGPVAADGLGQMTCSSYTRELPIASEVASAALLANVLNRPDSLRATSQRLFRDSAGRIGDADEPIDLCPSHCELPGGPQVVFRSEPRHTLDDYDQLDKCEQMLDNTRDDPLLYEDRVFDSVGALTHWWREFARGKGSDGKDLFQRCDGRCSPRYTSVITQNGAQLVVDTEVVCGHARDRQDNQFDLAYSLRWTCRDRSRGTRHSQSEASATGPSQRSGGSSGAAEATR
jgi:hypothetical protein